MTRVIVNTKLSAPKTRTGLDSTGRTTSSTTPSDALSSAPSATIIRQSDDRLLTAGEVARLFGVTPKAVARWADRGKLEYVRTPGGHRRFYAHSAKQLHNNHIRGIS